MALGFSFAFLSFLFFLGGEGGGVDFVLLRVVQVLRVYGSSGC